MPKRNRVIAIQERVVTRDRFGGEVETWVDLTEVWARVNQTGVSENFDNNANLEHAVRNAQIDILYREDVDETMRVIYQQHAWDIEGIGELGYKHELRLFCRTAIGGTRFIPTPISIRGGLSADAIPEASEFTIDHVGSRLTFDPFAAMHVLLWRIATESDITSVVFTSDPTGVNQISAFTKWPDTIELNGESGNVWVSNQSLTFTAEHRELEIA